MLVLSRGLQEGRRVDGTQRVALLLAARVFGRSLLRPCKSHMFLNCACLVWKMVA